MDTNQDEIRLVDIACNLTDEMFRGVYRGKKLHEDDFDSIIERACQAGVHAIIVVGNSLSDSQQAIKICRANKHPTVKLYCTVGCHPTHAYEFDKENNYYDKLLELIESNRDIVKAVGECGLDYDRLNYCKKEPQLKYFELQLDLAQKTGLPLFLHSRNAEDDFIEIMTRNRHKYVDGVVHSFTGEASELKKLLELGLYIGVNGCSMKTDQQVANLKQVPVDRLLLETDAPWCSVRNSYAIKKYVDVKPTFDLCRDESEKTLAEPITIVSKPERWQPNFMLSSRNEPCQTRQILYIMSELLKINPKTLADNVLKTARKLFKLA